MTREKADRAAALNELGLVGVGERRSGRGRPGLRRGSGLAARARLARAGPQHPGGRARPVGWSRLTGGNLLGRRGSTTSGGRTGRVGQIRTVDPHASYDGQYIGYFEHH